MRDLLIEKDPIRIDDIDFPKDEFSRYFSIIYYIQKLINGEKHERKWLVYSKDLDIVFYFYYKLFNSASSISKLANVGTRDWRNLSAKLKSYEMSNEHIINMSS